MNRKRCHVFILAFTTFTTQMKIRTGRISLHAHHYVKLLSYGTLAVVYIYIYSFFYHSHYHVWDFISSPANKRCGGRDNVNLKLEGFLPRFDAIFSFFHFLFFIFSPKSSFSYYSPGAISPIIIINHRDTFPPSPGYRDLPGVGASIHA